MVLSFSPEWSNGLVQVLVMWRTRTICVLWGTLGWESLAAISKKGNCSSGKGGRTADEQQTGEGQRNQNRLHEWINFFREMALSESYWQNCYFWICISPPEFTIIIFASLFTDNMQGLKVDTRTDISHLYVEFKALPCQSFCLSPFRTAHRGSQ